jgi:hypothetical protein
MTLQEALNSPAITLVASQGRPMSYLPPGPVTSASRPCDISLAVLALATLGLRDRKQCSPHTHTDRDASNANSYVAGR